MEHIPNGENDCEYCMELANGNPLAKLFQYPHATVVHTVHSLLASQISFVMLTPFIYIQDQ